MARQELQRQACRICVVRACSGCGIYVRGEAEAEAGLVREHGSAWATQFAAARRSRGTALLQRAVRHGAMRARGDPERGWTSMIQQPQQLQTNVADFAGAPTARQRHETSDAYRDQSATRKSRDGSGYT